MKISRPETAQCVRQDYAVLGWLEGEGLKPSRTAKGRRISARILPLIDKDFPALDALRFEDALLEPGVVFHFFAHFIFIGGVEEQKRTPSSTSGPPIQMKPSATSIDELGVPSKRLLPRALR